MDELKIKLETVELTTEDFNSAAMLLAEAFYNNPSHQYIFADSARRLKLLEWGLKANLKLNLASPESRSHSFALIDREKRSSIRQVRAMGFWHPPELFAVSTYDKIRSGFLFAPFKFGRQTYQRLSEVMTAMEKIKQEVLGQNKAWYLNNMAVAKELRGMGIGTQLLDKQLQTKVIPSQFPALLMTQKESSVRFYQQLGFKIAHRSLIGQEGKAFTNWCLLFKAAT